MLPVVNGATLCATRRRVGSGAVALTAWHTPIVIGAATAPSGVTWNS